MEWVNIVLIRKERSKSLCFANDYGRTNWFRVIFLQLKKGCQGPQTGSLSAFK